MQTCLSGSRVSHLIFIPWTFTNGPQSAQELETTGWKPQAQTSAEHRQHSCLGPAVSSSWVPCHWVLLTAVSTVQGRFSSL